MDLGNVIQYATALKEAVYMDNTGVSVASLLMLIAAGITLFVMTFDVVV